MAQAHIIEDKAFKEWVRGAVLALMPLISWHNHMTEATRQDGSHTNVKQDYSHSQTDLTTALTHSCEQNKWAS